MRMVLGSPPGERAALEGSDAAYPTANRARDRTTRLRLLLVLEVLLLHDSRRVAADLATRRERGGKAARQR